MADYDFEDRPPLRSRGSVAGAFFGPIVALAIIGGICALVWVNRDEIGRASNETADSRSPDVAAINAAIADLKGEFTSTTQSLTSSIETLRDEVRQLSAQNAAMAAKLDAQRALAPAGSQDTPVTRPAPATPSVAKRPPPPRAPSGSISVGGAPLPDAPAGGR